MLADPAIHILFERLSEQDILELDNIVPSLDDPYAQEWCQGDRNSARWKSLTLRFCTHFVPESRSRTLLSYRIPPPDIHMMQRADTWFIGDIYSTSMALECLQLAQMEQKIGHNYMDFGCSSGSLVRVMSACYPDSNWFGTDPVEASVKWASENLPSGVYRHSGQKPPLAFDEAYFSGVTAISIWSHFSEQPALDWFAEMARIIKPGGWLFFTTHGNRTIRWAKDRIEANTLENIRLSLRKNHFHFENVFGGEKHYGLETQDWGDTYISPKWMMDNLHQKWDMLLFLEGRNQWNQDCYVLKRRWV